MKGTLSLIIVCIYSVLVFGDLGNDSFLPKEAIPDQDWGYVTISEQFGSHMFWWLYGSSQVDRTKAPLTIWLQGGPGGSAEFGNFLEIGPVDVNLKPRNTTWLQYSNLLFVDNPVGTGYSYTDDPAGFCTTDQQIADQLVLFLSEFLQIHPIFQTIPLWIFSESYGGKMASHFGMAIDKAVKSNKLKVNLIGVGLGDSWISPIDCMFSYAPFLLSTSLVDSRTADNLTSFAKQAQAALDNNNGEKATQFWRLQQQFAEKITGGVNFYNFLYYTDYLPESQLDSLLNGPIKEKLGIIPEKVSWGGQSNEVFQNMQGDFMKSSVEAVDYLLNNDYQVFIFSGQLDIIVDYVCTDMWVKRLTWKGMPSFMRSSREVLGLPGDTIPNAYRKQHENLSFWSILRAGHMVPYDNGPMALQMFHYALTGK